MSNSIEISVPCGKMLGINSDDCLEFRGIEYATANRFEYPKQVTSWDGIYDATCFKECSYQRRGFEDDATCNAFYHKEFRKGLSFTYSEKCLFLNIWTPKNAKDCPVVIYIHGGSFTGGSANEAQISGAELSKNGVILVAMNYRLGPFGFCAHPDLTDENGVCGNYGLFDQYTAIKWVKDNIKGFGGNPEKITLLGQSAGAMSVDIQLSNKMCKGWFSGAVMMSGAGLQRMIMKPATPEKALPFWETVLKNAKVTTVEELKKVDERTLFYAWSDACKTVKGSMKYTLPVYDGKLLCEDNFSVKALPDIPYILGVTTADMIPTALEFVTKKWIKNTEKYNKSKCYSYLFARDLPGDDNGAWHSCDLLYMFSTLKYNWRKFEEVDYKISSEMSNMLCAFAKTGNPNCKSVPEWKSDSKNPMVFSENIGLGKWKTAKLIKNTLFNRGPV